MLKVDPELLKEPGFVKSGIGDGTRKKRSKVWEYFSVNPDNPNQCVCVICKESVNYLNRGTSSMTSHLKCEHDIWVIKFARKEMGGEGVDKKVRKAAAWRCGIRPCLNDVPEKTWKWKFNLKPFQFQQ